MFKIASKKMKLMESFSATLLHAITAYCMDQKRKISLLIYLYEPNHKYATKVYYHKLL